MIRPLNLKVSFSTAVISVILWSLNDTFRYISVELSFESPYREIFFLSFYYSSFPFEEFRGVSFTRSQVASVLLLGECDCEQVCPISDVVVIHVDDFEGEEETTLPTQILNTPLFLTLIRRPRGCSSGQHRLLQSLPCCSRSLRVVFWTGKGVKITYEDL